jgi:hypothetical protein
LLVFIVVAAGSAAAVAAAAVVRLTASDLGRCFGLKNYKQKKLIKIFQN